MYKPVFLVLFVFVSSIFFLLPIGNASHVEALSYMMETSSFLYPDISLSDPIWPLNAEYFFYSRAGAVLAMRPLSLLAPGEGFRVLMLMATPVFVAGLALLVRSWSKCGLIACLAAIATIPVVFEATHFFNDSMPASALGYWALFACFFAGWRGGVLGGLVLGLAIFFRLDQIFQLPVAVLILTFSSSSLFAAISRLIPFFSALTLAYLGLETTLTPEVSLTDKFVISSILPELWGWTLFPVTDDIAKDVTVFLMAAGQALPLAAIGFVVLLSRSPLRLNDLTWQNFRRLAQYAALVVYPLAFCLITLGLNASPRQFLILVPQVAVLGALAVQYFLDAPLRSWKPAVVVAALLLCLVPTPEFRWREVIEAGNQQITGRLWTFADRRAWQDRRKEEYAGASALLAALPHDNDDIFMIMQNGGGVDRAFQVVLLREGYRPVARDTTNCGQITEEWHKGSRRIRVYRTHVPHLWAPQYPDKYAQEATLFFAQGEACIRSLDTSSQYVDGRLIVGDSTAAQIIGTDASLVPLEADLLKEISASYSDHLDDVLFPDMPDPEQVALIAAATKTFWQYKADLGSRLRGRPD